MLLQMFSRVHSDALVMAIVSPHANSMRYILSMVLLQLITKNAQVVPHARKACPRNLIEMVPFSHENMMVVACRNKESAKSHVQFCKVGCIGCGICAKQTDLFKVSDNLARMDYVRYEPSEKTETAMNKCPTKVIVYRGKSAPEPQKPTEKNTVAASK